MHPREHRDHHKQNGDPARWGRRGHIARAFGGKVSRGFGGLDALSTFLGILSGRIRTDNFDNFVSDMTGMQSQEDFWRQQEELRKQLNPNAPPGTLFF